LRKSKRAESKSTVTKPTPTPIPAFAPVLRPALAGEAVSGVADAAGVSVVVDGAPEEAVGFLLKSVLVPKDDAGVLAFWSVDADVGTLARAASMENRGDDTSSSPSQLPPKGMNLSTKSFASCTSSAGMSTAHEYRSLSLMLIPSAFM
jgi:hypothetical protein